MGCYKISAAQPHRVLPALIYKSGLTSSRGFSLLCVFLTTYSEISTPVCFTTSPQSSPGEPGFTSAHFLMWSGSLTLECVCLHTLHDSFSFHKIKSSVQQLINLSFCTLMRCHCRRTVSWSASRSVSAASLCLSVTWQSRGNNKQGLKTQPAPLKIICIYSLTIS